MNLSAYATSNPQCVICGSTQKVQMNHIGGRKFLAEMTMPFCSEGKNCHGRFHVLVQQAGINLEWTDDPIERFRRAFAAIKVAEWMLLEMLKEKQIQPEVKS